MENKFVRLIDEDGEAVETSDEYLSRLREMLPNLPEDVFGQWVRDHPDQFARWAFLDLRRLRFEREWWSAETIEETNYGPHLSVYTLLHHYRTGVSEYKRENIERCLREQGTWPRPVIVLHRPNGLRGNEPGWCQHTPYYLLEGHHRMAVLLLWIEQGRQLEDEHEIWVVRRSN